MGIRFSTEMTSLCLLAVLFTVEAERPSYEAEFGGDVVLGCRFEPKPVNSPTELKVTWHWIASETSREVYQRDKGKDILESQHADYQGRAKLLTEELDKGLAKLQVNTESEACRRVMGHFLQKCNLLCLNCLGGC